MGALIYNLFEKWRFVRRFGILGLYFLIGFATIAIFLNMTQVSLPVATAYATLCGLLGAVFKFYNEKREK